MTVLEAIETIKIAIAEVEWNYPMGYAVAFETAISALEKQIPKKPNIHIHVLQTSSHFIYSDTDTVHLRDAFEKWVKIR